MGVMGWKTTTMQIDVDHEPPWPADTDWDALSQRAADAVAAVAPELASDTFSVSVLFTADAEVHELNREWRGKDRATNVLSFPMVGRADLLAAAKAGSLPGPPQMLGDIALAFETCAREAADKRIAIADHAAHLVVHGLFHLAGYDHETGEGDAARMEALETKALALMGVADPYGDGEGRDDPATGAE